MREKINEVLNKQDKKICMCKHGGRELWPHHEGAAYISQISIGKGREFLSENILEGFSFQTLHFLDNHRPPGTY